MYPDAEWPLEAGMPLAAELEPRGVSCAPRAGAMPGAGRGCLGKGPPLFSLYSPSPLPLPSSPLLSADPSGGLFWGHTALQEPLAIAPLPAGMSSAEILSRSVHFQPLICSY